MNVLPHDKQIAVISALTEGCSIRATSGSPAFFAIRSCASASVSATAARSGTMSLCNSVQVNQLELDELWDSTEGIARTTRIAF